MKKTIIAAAVMALSAASVYAEDQLDNVPELAPVVVTVTGYTNYQVQRQETPDVYNNAAHIQETAPGLKSPYIGAFTGNQVTQTIDGIKFSNSLFRGGPNQYYSWIPDQFVQSISVSDGGNVGGTIDRKLGIAPSHVGASYNSSLGFTEDASYKNEHFGIAIFNADFGNVKTAKGTVPHSSYNQTGAMAEAYWNQDNKTTMMMTHSGDLERTDKWNGGQRMNSTLTGLSPQLPSVYTWQSQDYTLLKHEARIDNFNLTGAFQKYEEKILDGVKPIHSNIDSYTVNGEYFFENGFSVYSTNTIENIMYDNGVNVSSTNPIRVDNQTWGTYKQGARWYGELAGLDVITSFGYKEVSAGRYGSFNNPEGSLIVGKNGFFGSYDRSTNTPSYFNLASGITSGKGSSIPNPSLKEEYADTYRLGYKSGGLYFDVYDKHLSNAIQSRTINAAQFITQPYNGGTMDVYGSTLGYKNDSIMGTKFGINTRFEYAFGQNNPPTGASEPVSKVSPLTGYAKLNYAGAWVEWMGQAGQTRLSQGDLTDVRTYGHNQAYNMVNVGYTDTVYQNFDYTVAIMNVTNSDGRVWGSSVDLPKRGVFLSGKYRF